MPAFGSTVLALRGGVESGGSAETADDRDRTTERRDEGARTRLIIRPVHSFLPFRTATPVIVWSAVILPEERERKEVRRTKERVGLYAMRSRRTASDETINFLVPRVRPGASRSFDQTQSRE
jgi:hypothetical protein